MGYLYPLNGAGVINGMLLRFICIITLFILSYTWPAFGQDLQKTIKIGFKPSPLNEALKKFDKASGLLITFASDLVDPHRIGEIPAKRRTCRQTLELLLSGTGLSYKMVDHHILLIGRENSDTVSKPAPALIRHMYSVKGSVTDSAGHAIAGAYVLLKQARKSAISDDDGKFQLLSDTLPDSLLVSSMGFQAYSKYISQPSEINIVLRPAVTRQIEDIEVNTGYQTLVQGRATGSYFKVGAGILDRRMNSTTILERLEDMVPGLQFSKNLLPSSAANESPYSIRGRSTINSNPAPLIVVDNFPYDGPIESINPADVESITILRDAASSSIWGALSGNGVIVITTRTGKKNSKASMAIRSSMTVAERPDLYYNAQLSSAGYIQLEEFIFNNGFPDYSANAYSYLSPAMEIMRKRKEGLIDPLLAEQQLARLRATDTRTDLNSFFNRTSINQQHAVNVSGGGTDSKYYVSFGYDRNLPQQVGNFFDRFTLTANNSLLLLNGRLEVGTKVAFTRSTYKDNYRVNGINRPYLDIADDAGTPLVVPADVRQSFKDTAGAGLLTDWNFRPLQDLSSTDNRTAENDLRASLQLKYKFLSYFHANAYYQYSNGTSKSEYRSFLGSYYVRNLINSFSIINRNAMSIQRPIPLGGINDFANSGYNSHNVRLSISFDHTFNHIHSLNVLTGYDFRLIGTDYHSYRLYGIQNGVSASGTMDFSSIFTNFYSGQQARIPSGIANYSRNNNYLSAYFTSTYTLLSRYGLSANVRRDESNLFGVETNQKGVPLWSLGTMWLISKEGFYPKNPVVEHLKLRASYGFNGNVNTAFTAYTTVRRNSSSNRFSSSFGSITNPANSSLRWEKVGMLNLGLDFRFANKRVEGSVDFYLKKAKDLIAASPVDPTTGVSSYTGNTADMKSRGLDLQLSSQNLSGRLSWTTDLLLSCNRDKVVTYKVARTLIGSYMVPGKLNPQPGFPLYSIYSFRNAGLDDRGNPLVLLNGQPSTDYAALATSGSFDNLKFFGSANPTFWGSLRNTFGYRGWELSALISFKAGYFFRRPGISYNAVFQGQDNGHDEFYQRWQKPGDENLTSVPSMTFPGNSQRDDAYRYSDKLVEKGDHLRFQDIRLSYAIQPKPSRSQPFEQIMFYLNVNNMGILWRANRYRIDP